MTIYTKFIIFHLQNTPNNLQLLSNTPTHHIFYLLNPINPTQNTLPKIYYILQIKTYKTKYNKIRKKTYHQLNLHPYQKLYQPL